ncbi:MAG: FMN-binding glutamate synthase family protein [Actinobacteria bacterium]|nr:FMN-binding glutamate synthase family protein [Actinomycetota bacterium]
MNLQRPNSNEATETSNRSRSVVPCSGICTRCSDDCKGNCEVFKSSFRGREVIYPGPFGHITAGGDKDYPVDYSHLNICGYAFGLNGLPEGLEAGPDTATFPTVDTMTEFGYENKVKMKVPVFTGALGSTEVARANWEHFAVGAAISGISLVCGENVCGIDPALERDANGKVTKAPDMERRLNLYRQYHEGFGDILVQMNVEDTRLGVADYVIGKLGVETVELKWGQGAKCIGGEIKVNTIERALSLQDRGYIVTPDPSNPAIQESYKAGAIKQFERHSRLGFVDEEDFYNTVQRLRDMGAKRVTLKTGAYPMRELAMAMKWASNAKIDFLTIDGAPGGTGMSPWRMMEEWGVPTFYLQSMAYELACELDKQGAYVPDLAIAGGFSEEAGIYKGLAMGAPYFKAVCMGRALMIPGFVGKNIDKWIKEGDLPKSVAPYGTTKEEIFVTYETLREKWGDEVEKFPLGAIGIYSYVDRLKVGLQQLMAGSRCMNLESITRNELMALTEESSKISGIPYIMDAYRDEAMKIIRA